MLLGRARSRMYTPAPRHKLMKVILRYCAAARAFLDSQQQWAVHWFNIECMCEEAARRRPVLLALDAVKDLRADPTKNIQHGINRGTIGVNGKRVAERGEHDNDALAGQRLLRDKKQAEERHARLLARSRSPRAEETRRRSGKCKGHLLEHDGPLSRPWGARRQHRRDLHPGRRRFGAPGAAREAELDDVVPQGLHSAAAGLHEQRRRPQVNCDDPLSRRLQQDCAYAGRAAVAADQVQLQGGNIDEEHHVPQAADGAARSLHAST